MINRRQFLTFLGVIPFVPKMGLPPKNECASGATFLTKKEEPKIDCIELYYPRTGGTKLLAKTKNDKYYELMRTEHGHIFMRDIERAYWYGSNNKT